MNISPEEKNILLECARESIYTSFSGASPAPPDYEKYPALKIPAGAFVTLRKHNHLRGCVGFIESSSYLFDTVTQAARYAAFQDSRFPPVGQHEMKDITVEISVLSPAEPMNSYNDIQLGVHGLILEEKGRRALLLPQVPIEHHLNRDEFLSALCEKAGLYRNYWKEKQLTLFSFTAAIFSENEEE